MRWTHYSARDHEYGRPMLSLELSFSPVWSRALLSFLTTNPHGMRILPSDGMNDANTTSRRLWMLMHGRTTRKQWSFQR